MKYQNHFPILLISTLLLILNQILFSQAFWIPQTSNTTASLRSVHFVNPNTGIACGLNIILSTTNGGMNWTTVYSGSNWCSNVKFKDASTAYLTSDWYLLKSTNSGLNWFTATYLADSPSRIYIYGNTITVPCSGVIVRSTDNGATWTSYSVTNYNVGQDYSFINENTGWSISARMLPPPNPNQYLYNYVSKTTNGGINWATVNTYQSTFMPLYFTVSFADNNTGYISGMGGFRKTTTGGTSWYVMEAGSLFSLIVYAFNKDTVFLSGSQYPSTILRTTNGGTNWKIDTVDSGGKPIRDVFLLDRNTGWAVGDSGKILITASAFIGIINYSNDVPKHFYLGQNYPNPFNPITKIRFSTPLYPPFDKGGTVRSTGGFTTLKIYDILGREVATLVNEQLKPGSYEIEWDGTNYPSGVYYYQLTAGEFRETKKMILIR